MSRYDVIEYACWGDCAMQVVRVPAMPVDAPCPDRVFDTGTKTPVPTLISDQSATTGNTSKH